MTGSGKIGTTVWRRRFYRRPPGLGWLLALVLVPLLLAAIGYGVNRPKIDVSGPNLHGPNLTLPSAGAPGLSLSPLSILRNGNGFTLNGDLPDIGARQSLVDMLKDIFGPDVQLIDNLAIKPNSSAIDFPGLSAVLKAAGSIPDFSFKVGGDTVTLTGTAASEDEQAAVGAAAEEAWENLNIVNEIGVRPPAPEPAPGAAPTGPGPSGNGAGCGDLQADITSLMSTPITFVTDGHTLSPGSQQQLSEVAGKLNACPDAQVSVNGYTDNTGNDAINVPLSGNQAKSVLDFLVSQGVPADHVTSKGFGSADPVASNDTPDGRAQNRRVAIVVS